jgi:hypothetical protein
MKPSQQSHGFGIRCQNVSRFEGSVTILHAWSTSLCPFHSNFWVASGMTHPQRMCFIDPHRPQQMVEHTKDTISRNVDFHTSHSLIVHGSIRHKNRKMVLSQFFCTPKSDALHNDHHVPSQNCNILQFWDIIMPHSQTHPNIKLL